MGLATLVFAIKPSVHICEKGFSFLRLIGCTFGRTMVSYRLFDLVIAPTLFQIPQVYITKIPKLRENNVFEVRRSLLKSSLKGLLYGRGSSACCCYT